MRPIWGRGAWPASALSWKSRPAQEPSRKLCRSWNKPRMNSPEFSSRLSGKRKVKTGPGRASVLHPTRDAIEPRAKLRTAESARVRAGLRAEMSELERRQRRVATQYEITRILAESPKLLEAAPNLLRAICENLA